MLSVNPFLLCRQQERTNQGDFDALSFELDANNTFYAREKLHFHSYFNVLHTLMYLYNASAFSTITFCDIT